MAEFRTRSGRVLSDADIQALADEAEEGYDVNHLLARRRGKLKHDPYQLVADLLRFIAEKGPEMPSDLFFRADAFLKSDPLGRSKPPSG